MARCSSAGGLRTPPNGRPREHARYAAAQAGAGPHTGDRRTPGRSANETMDGADLAEQPRADPVGSSSSGDDPPRLTSSSESEGEAQQGGGRQAPATLPAGITSSSVSSDSSVPHGGSRRPQATDEAGWRERNEAAAGTTIRRLRARAQLGALEEAARERGRKEAEELLAAARRSAARCAQERPTAECRRASCTRTAASGIWSSCCRCREDIAGPAMRAGNQGFLFGRCSTCEGICHLRAEQLG